MKLCSVAIVADVKNVTSYPRIDNIVFPEFILDIPDDVSSLSSESAEVDVNNSSVNSSHTDKFSAEDLEQMAEESARHEDIRFEEFKKISRKRPKQVLYSFFLYPL